MKKSFMCLCLILSLSMLWTQDFESIEKTRPSVALVLSGANARGFAHIAVIELIEELGIPIDLVVGTSSGAIIGGLYSAGYSGKELAEELIHYDWVSALIDFTTHPFETALGSHYSGSNLVNVQLDDNYAIDLGEGLLTGQLVYNKLKSLTAKIPAYMHFDNLITPFRAAVVDIVTGELIFMEQGDLSEAIRASMSLPTLFEPFPIDGNLYIDGFARSNLPIKVAKDLGYDIIIAVEMSTQLLDNAASFESNPFTALSQMMNVQQSVGRSSEYELADLVLYPDVFEFGQVEYTLAPQIYEKGKKEAERYREDLLALRSRIFPNEEVDNDHIPSDKYVYERQITYKDLPNISVNDIILNNVHKTDEQLILTEFNTIAAKKIDNESIEQLLRTAYETSNYNMITARIDTRSESAVLEMEFYQKDRNAIHVGVVQNFEGTLSNSASWEMSFTGAIQFRNLNDLGAIFSIQGSLLNKSGLELLFLQPLTKTAFVRAKANVFNLFDTENSGFTIIDVKESQFRQGSALFAFGLFFSPEHKLLNEVGLHWVDSSQANISTASVLSDTGHQRGFAFDIASRYTFNTLDNLVFPTMGYFNDFKLMGVVPISETSSPQIFDVITNYFTVAVPFNKFSGLIINGFVGTNISEGLKNNSELITKYGFTTYDRTFFPHIMQRYSYGIHKVAIKTDFQFQPITSTILGSPFFAGVGGAIGGVWSDYKSFNAIDFGNIDWQSSVFLGVRIKDAIGLVIRGGAGSYDDDIAPFCSVDFTVKYY